MANTAATMTLADFITEAALYPHSKERFNLVKECNEYELMAMCLDNTAFVTESYNLTAETIDGLAILTESVDFTEAGEFITKLKARGSSIWKGITSGWARMIGAVLAMYNTFIAFIAKRTAPPADSLGAAEILGKLKGLSDDQRAKLYTSVYAVLAAGVEGGKPSDKCGFISHASSPKVRKLGVDILNALHNGIKASDPQAKPFTADMTEIFISTLVVSIDGVNVRVPKFADQAFGVIPRLIDITASMKSAMAVSDATMIKSAATRIRALTKDLKSLHVGGSVPTPENISNATVTLTAEQVKDQHDKLVEARDKFIASVPEIVKVAGADAGNVTAAAKPLAELNKAVTDFQEVFAVYSGVAIKAMADAIIAIGAIDKMNAKITKIFGSITAS